MRIEVRLAPDATRLWQLHVVEALMAQAGTSVAVVATGSAPPLPLGASSLLALEGLLSRARGERLSQRIDFNRFAAFVGGDGTADLVADLAGDVEGKPAIVPRLSLRCDGEAIEPGALAAALDERAPLFETVFDDGADRRVLSRWSPAVESPNNLAAAFDMLLARAAHMLVREVARLERGPVGDAPSLPAVASRHRGAGAFLLRSIEARIAARLDRLLKRAPNWYVAWRETGASPETLPDLSGAFHRLPDDGARFYADPFLWQQGGETLLFVEEFPFATEKGILSLSRLGPDGRFTRPQPILEADCHLSYPFVFAHAGSMWMIPETSCRRTVELYRADSFPERWTLHSVLIEDADLGDATLTQIDGTFWLFAASRERGTSSWDALSLYSAPLLFGPWTSYADNPVLVDLRAARPAGRMLSIGGSLVRPVQDCAGGYGAALGFATIDEVSPLRYRQTTRAVARPAPPDTGLHTYDRAGAIEAIDRFGSRRDD